MKDLRTFLCTFMASVLMLAGAQALRAQSGDASSNEDKGWNLFEEFQGSSNSLGQIMKLDTSVGYDFNRYFGGDVGLPVYFVHASQSAQTSGLRSANGLGNAYLDLRLTFRNPILNYASTLTGWAPTGSTQDGFSTGRFTYDWSNRFDHGFGPFRPFAVIGVADTVPDTLFFTRPFTSLGTLTHFEGGATMRIIPRLRVGASAYDILPYGQQKVYSRLRSKQGMVIAGQSMMSMQGRGGAFANSSLSIGNDLTRDDGVSAWVTTTPIRTLAFQVGFTRSVPYDLNTVSFGVGVDVGSLVRMARTF